MKSICIGESGSHLSDRDVVQGDGRSRQGQQAQSKNYFPLSKLVLWDRSPTQSIRFINVPDIVPQLFLSTHDIALVLSKLESVAQDYVYPTITFALHIKPMMDVTSEEIQIFKRTLYGSPKYVFTLVEESSTSNLTLPVTLDSASYHDPDNLSFDPQSTRYNSLTHTKQ